MYFPGAINHIPRDEKVPVVSMPQPDILSGTAEFSIHSSPHRLEDG